MWRKQDKGQLLINEFHLPFGGKLKPDNRPLHLVRLPEWIPWQELRGDLCIAFHTTIGAPAKPMRLALDSLYIKHCLGKPMSKRSIRSGRTP